MRRTRGYALVTLFVVMGVGASLGWKRAFAVRLHAERPSAKLTHEPPASVHAVPRTSFARSTSRAPVNVKPFAAESFAAECDDPRDFELFRADAPPSSVDPRTAPASPSELRLMRRRASLE